MHNRLHNAISLYMEGIRDGNAQEAIEKYTGDKYTQHSTGVADGKEGFVAFFEPFLERNPIRQIEVIRALYDEEEQKAFLHVYQKITDTEGQVAEWVTTDFFDFDEHDKIIEHWDVIAEYSPTTPSGHTSIDGATQVEDEHATEENKAVVRGLIENLLMEGGDRTKIDEYISSEEYIQHNKDVPDGIESLRPMVMAQDSPLQYHRIVLMVGQGNFVATLCDATFNGSRNAQVDIFRLKDGKVVEHWDNVEPLPEGPQLNSGKF